jgi:hypothetical protein
VLVLDQGCIKGVGSKRVLFDDTRRRRGCGGKAVFADSRIRLLERVADSWRAGKRSGSERMVRIRGSLWPESELGRIGRSRSLPGWDICFWLYGVVERAWLIVLDRGSGGDMILDGL